MSMSYYYNQISETIIVSMVFVKKFWQRYSFPKHIPFIVAFLRVYLDGWLT